MGVIETGTAHRQQIGLLAERQLCARPFQKRQSFISAQDRDRIFFHPGDLGGEASDLGVEFFELLLVCCFVCLGFAFLFEEGGQSGNSGGFPGADLVGMEVVVSSNLREGLL